MKTKAQIQTEIEACRARIEQIQDSPFNARLFREREKEIAALHARWDALANELKTATA